MILKYSALAVITTLLAACATPQARIEPRIPFVAAEYSALPKEGNAVLVGQAFLKTKGSDVKTCAGNKVVLNPVTSYSLDWYEKTFVKRLEIAEGDPRQDVYIRTTVCNAEGRFKFKKIPAGEYFVFTKVSMKSSTGYQSGLQKQNANLATRVTVKEGEETEVIITK